MVHAIPSRRRSKKISGIINNIKHKPNSLQLAIAQAAVGLMHKYPRQLYVVPGSKGKSRIATTIALLMLETKNFCKQVHLVF